MATNSLVESTAYTARGGANLTQTSDPRLRHTNAPALEVREAVIYVSKSPLDSTQRCRWN